MPMLTEARFMSRVKKVRRRDRMCWEWQGSCNAKGYGWFWADGKNHRAHRWAYEHYVGPVPEGLQLDHLCRNTKCVRPSHLEPVTGAVNEQRKAEANPTCRRGHDAEYQRRRKTDGKRYCAICANASYWKRKGFWCNANAHLLCTRVRTCNQRVR